MALDDVVFQEGDRQNFIVEANKPMSGAIGDILTEAASPSGQLITEVTLIAGGGSPTYTRSRVVNG